MSIQAKSKHFQEQQQLLIIQYFKRLSWNFTINNIQDILKPNNVQEMLLAIDYDYFQKYLQGQGKLSSLAQTIKAYLKFKISSSLLKQLSNSCTKSWIALLLYLFANCEQKNIFIQQMMQCSSQTQQYIMILIGSISERQEDYQQQMYSSLSGVEQIQNQLKEKNQQLDYTQKQLENIKLENISLRQENQKLHELLNDYIENKTEQLESVNVSTLQQLIQSYKNALDVNQRLSSKLQKFEYENSELQSICSGISQDLIIAKQQNQQKQTALRTRVPSVKGQRSGKSILLEIQSDKSSSEEQITTIKDSVETHIKPLKQQIGYLSLSNNHLKNQISSFFNQFEIFAKQLKPLKDLGLFEDLPRSFF